MISSVIVLLTLLMAAVFVLVYVLRPGWRARIEQPKYGFQQQLQHYDRLLQPTKAESHAEERP
ncbi:MAG: hypothetical protein R3F50_21180 [Gammaproteobacteria bacterium]